MILYVTHASNFDFKLQLYQPLENSVLSKAHQFIFPHQNTTEAQDSKQWIQQADVILAEVTHPSTGQGIELGWAHNIGKPIICFHTSEKPASSSLQLISNHMFRYENEAHLLTTLSAIINNLQKL